MPSMIFGWLGLDSSASRSSITIRFEERVIAAATQQAVSSSPKARALLVSLLDRKQYAQYIQDGTFIVQGLSGCRYRINTGTIIGNIEVLGSGRRIRRRLCCMLAHSFPKEDHLVAQLLHLRHNEDEFLRVARTLPAGDNY